MKYCKKCGMLLEDNMDTCIKCGNDVSKKEAYNKYPEKMQAMVDAEKKDAYDKSKSIGMIIAIFVLLILLILLFVFKYAESNEVGEESVNLLNTENACFVMNYYLM